MQKIIWQNVRAIHVRLNYSNTVNFTQYLTPDLLKTGDILA